MICSQLADIDLSDPIKLGVSEALSRWTAQLVASTGSWGPSRKALNLFLRDVSYNHWTRKHYRFEQFEHELELPLDGVVMKALRVRDPSLPTPPAVKNLRQATSEVFQSAARRIAADDGLVRVHLDLALWGGGLARDRG